MFQIAGFDDFLFDRARAAGVSDAQLYKQAGNSVTVNIVYEIGVRLKKMEAASMKFNILYVDPPWAYKVYSRKGQGRSAENHYHTMNIEDIYNLDIASIAAEDSILFLWVTFPCLEQGFETIRRWGFQYKTLGFCWVKRCKKQTEKWFWGLGFWTRATQNSA